MDAVVGKRIKRARDKINISQQDLSKKIGMSNSVLSRIESGERPARSDELVKIADALDVTTEYLLDNRSSADYISGPLDVYDILNSNEQLLINGKEASESDKARIREMLKLMFPEK